MQGGCFVALKSVLNSHDRIMTAVDLQEPDHVPLFFALLGRGKLFDRGYGFSFGNINRFDARYPYSFRNQIQKVEQILALGLDDTIRLEPPLGWAEEYVVEGVRGLQAAVREVRLDDGGSRGLEKTYHTPAGDLRAVVKITDDWPHGENIPLFSDFNVSRAREFPIKGPQDIEKLKYLLGEPTAEEYRRFKEEAALLRRAAKRLGVVFEGGRTTLGDSLVWLLGIPGLIYGCFDDPEFIGSLLDTVYEWEKKRLEIIIDQGVELVFHSAWYEMTDFWTPKLYRQLIKPRVARLSGIAREAGVKFGYIITKSYDVLYEDFLEMGFDCLYGADPLQGRADLGFLKKKFKGKLCLWGGLNSAVTLGRGMEREIAAAVEEAIRTLAPGGGFVLFPVDNIMPGANPWSATRVLLDKWREIGSYPITVQ
jgi:hypothetical protein